MVNLITSEGYLLGASSIPSMNWDERPPGADIDLIVIHNISLPPGQFGGGWIDALFTNRLPSDADPYFATLQGLRVSAHLLISRNGSTTQYVSFIRRAWHAGASSWQGRVNCNDYSIGIELEGVDTISYTDEQYLMLAKVCRELLKAYPAIIPARIVGHSDVAPQRKTDPGPAFEWERLRRLLDLSIL